MGLGCMAGFSTLPSVSAPRLLGSSTALEKMGRDTWKGELRKKLRPHREKERRLDIYSHLVQM